MESIARKSSYIKRKGTEKNYWIFTVTDYVSPQF